MFQVAQTSSTKTTQWDKQPLSASTGLFGMGTALCRGNLDRAIAKSGKYGNAFLYRGLSSCLSSGMIQEICTWHLRSGFIPTPTSLKTPVKHGMLATWGLFKIKSSCLCPFLSAGSSTGEDPQELIQLVIQTWLFSDPRPHSGTMACCEDGLTQVFDLLLSREGLPGAPLQLGFVTACPKAEPLGIVLHSSFPLWFSTALFPCGSPCTAGSPLMPREAPWNRV